MIKIEVKVEIIRLQINKYLCHKNNHKLVICVINFNQN
jgi:hypothetical protein